MSEMNDPWQEYELENVNWTPTNGKKISSLELLLDFVKMIATDPEVSCLIIDQTSESTKKRLYHHQQSTSLIGQTTKAAVKPKKKQVLVLQVPMSNIT